MESAALSARAMPDRKPRATEDLVSQIFSQLGALEDTILAGKAITRSLADPITRIDGIGPTFGSDNVRKLDEHHGGSTADVIEEPPLIFLLERIRDRITSLEQLQLDTNNIAAVSSDRLNAAV